MIRALRAAGAAALLALAAAHVAAAPAAAQDLRCEAGDREVRGLHFVGNRAFKDAELARVVVTTASSALARLRFIGTRRCLDPVEFPRDLLRLEAYYRKRGYPQATVDTALRTVGPNAVDVTFRVVEGRPLRVDTLHVEGLAGVRVRQDPLRDFPLHPGSVFDRVALEAARDSARTRLRNQGYPNADALLSWSTDLERMTANATLTVVPGTFTRLGRIDVVVDTTGGERPRIPERVVRRVLGLRQGDAYSAAAVLEAQRALYQTDAYHRVEIRGDSARSPRDSVLPLRVTLDEGDLHAARVGAGWATLDCFRVQGDLTSYYFQPWAQRLELSGRVSRIGIGHPMRFSPAGFCRPARGDIYSDAANYYVGATVRQPTLLRSRLAPSLTLFSSRASEFNAFRRTTAIGALVSVASRAGSRLPSTVSYQLELGRTEANAAVFCAVFSACDDRSRDFFERTRPLGAIGYAVARNRADDPANPTTGTVQRLTLRHSSAFTGSHASQRFTKGVLDMTSYRAVGEGGTFTAHVQLGGLVGGAPPQERLYAGGPTTVRGYRQNELGPVVYLVTAYDTVRAPGSDTVVFQVDPARIPRPARTIPTGGNTLIVGNLELQVRSPVIPELLSLAVFTDVGQVWNRGKVTADFRGVRVTPGAGVRLKTLFGPFRFDLGYNPYTAPAGAAYFISSRDGGQQLYCVSPENTLPVPLPRGTVTTTPAPQRAGSCPASYRPAEARNFLQRLNPSIWIGNAF